MNQFAKSITIAFTLDQPESIRRALQQYQQHLSDGSAFRAREFDVEFVALLPDATQRPLQISDITDTELHQATCLALSKGNDDISHLQHTVINADDEVYISEVLLFALAMQHAPLLAEVVETAKAIVAYARRHNNTDDMWVDSMRLFGAEALFVLASYDVQYLVLLAQYMVRNWDDEHACGYNEFLSHFVQKYGWSRAVLNAFIHCDDRYTRIMMYMHRWESRLTYEEPGKYLRANPEEYRWFKQALTTRLMTTPMLMHPNGEALNEATPVHDIYESLFRSADFLTAKAFWQQPMGDSTLGEEARLLVRDILARSQQSLVCYQSDDIPTA